MIVASFFVACHSPASSRPPRPTEGVPTRCATDYDGPAPAVLHLGTRTDVEAELARPAPQAASDVARQLDDVTTARLVDTMAGTEHEGDGYYYRVNAVFRVADGFVVVKDLALWFHTLPQSGGGRPPPTLTDRSSLEIIGTVGHIRIATQPAIHHFVDLARGVYLRGVVEGPRQLAHWTIEADGPIGDGCTIYWL
ncbi:MAG TPA: hypothetical protein VFQ65_29530 [Kofleriaceae bacterium]|nr:hypothetical protein [Kofleriaceae bacterium]